jgi:tetratricopeptide (TPR) repeat protein
MCRTLLYLVSLFLVNALQAQDLRLDILSADSIAAAGDQKEALSYYNRIIYFDEEGLNHATLFKKIGLIRMQQKEYAQAAVAFESGYFSATDSVEKASFQNLKAKSLVYNGQFEDALIELTGLRGKPISDSAAYRLYLSTCLVMTGQSDSAVSLWKSLVRGDSLKVMRLDSLKEVLHDINHLSPNKAMWLSRVLPGAGQLYARRYAPALNSFLLVGGLAALCYLTAYNYTILDALFSVFPWFQRYYSGGAEKAGMMTQERKQALLKQSVKCGIQIVF